MDKLIMALKVVGVFAFLYSIFVFLPMVFTYLSNGDVRPWLALLTLNF